MIHAPQRLVRLRATCLLVSTSVPACQCMFAGVHTTFNIPSAPCAREACGVSVCVAVACGAVGVRLAVRALSRARAPHLFPLFEWCFVSQEKKPPISEM